MKRDQFLKELKRQKKKDYEEEAKWPNIEHPEDLYTFYMN